MKKLTSIFKSSFETSDLGVDEYNVIDAIEHSDELECDYLEIGAYRLYLKNSEVSQIETGETCSKSGRLAVLKCLIFMMNGYNFINQRKA